MGELISWSNFASISGIISSGFWIAHSLLAEHRGSDSLRFLLGPPIWSAIQAAGESVKSGSTWLQEFGGLKLISIPRKPAVVIWLGLIMWSFGSVTYEDHLGLVQARKAIYREKSVLNTRDQSTISDLRKQLEQQRNPNLGPAWTWESVKPTAKMSDRPGTIVLIMARRPVFDMILDVKCSVACVLSPLQSTAVGFMSGTWFDTQLSPPKKTYYCPSEGARPKSPRCR